MAAAGATDTQALGDGTGYQPRQLVLLGSGHTHLQILALLAAQPLVGWRITLVAPYNGHLHAAMVPGLVAGEYQPEECIVALEPLVRRSGVRWLSRNACALDPTQRTVSLDDGTQLNYDLLSINTGAVHNRALMEEHMPGVREHGLFLRPPETFIALWPQIAALGDSRPLRIAVIGPGTAAMEMAMVLRRRLPHCAITLLCGTQPGVSGKARVQLHAALRRRNITILHDSVVAVGPEALQLLSGASLACDIPVLATPSQAAPWLAQSGLAHDEDGLLLVDATQRSTSHPEVYVAGDAARPTGQAAGYSRHDARALARNLVAAAQGGRQRAHRLPRNPVRLVNCGDQRAMLLGENFTLQGRWVWQLQRWLARRFIARFRLPA